MVLIWLLYLALTTGGITVTEQQISAVRYAYMDLLALTRAQDWLEVCELKSAAAESVGDLEQAFGKYVEDTKGDSDG